LSSSRSSGRGRSPGTSRPGLSFRLVGRGVWLLLRFRLAGRLSSLEHIESDDLGGIQHAHDNQCASLLAFAAPPVLDVPEPVRPTLVVHPGHPDGPRNPVDPHLFGFFASGGPSGVGVGTGDAVRTSLVVVVSVTLLVSLSIYGGGGGFNLAG
jgi:hypothetical protein